MLKLRQIIPPVTARTPDGRTVRAWDFKQKKALAIAFLHADCRPCTDWLEQLRDLAAALKEAEGVALIVFPEAVSLALAPWANAQMVLAADVRGKSQSSFLGEQAFAPAGLERIGVFVSDRYGELRAQWQTGKEHVLPVVGEILSWLSHLQIACEECYSPEWPIE